MFEFLFTPPSKSLNQLSSKQIPSKTFQVSFAQNIFQRFFDKDCPSIEVSHLNTYPKKLLEDPITQKFRKSPHNKKSR